MALDVTDRVHTLMETICQDLSSKLMRPLNKLQATVLMISKNAMSVPLLFFYSVTLIIRQFVSMVELEQDKL